jgi:hypothetical protein
MMKKHSVGNNLVFGPDGFARAPETWIVSEVGVYDDSDSASVDCLKKRIPLNEMNLHVALERNFLAAVK